MIKLFLVRHGETTYNAENRVQGHEDAPLTPLGLRQAEAVAKRLEQEQFHAVYSSDLSRARVTAEIIGGPHGQSVTTTPLLREANLGVFQGLTTAEIAAQFPKELSEWRRDPASLRPPGGETTEQVIGRCRSFLSDILPQAEEESNLLIVGHGGSLRGLAVAALDLPDSAYHSLSFSNASLSVIELGRRAELRLLNDTCHLNSVLGDVTDADSGL